MELDATSVGELETALKSAGPIDQGGNNNPPPAPPAPPTPPTPPAPSNPPPAPANPPAPPAAPAASATPATGNNATPANGTPPAPPAAPAEDESVELTSLFGGRFNSIEQVEAELNRINELETQLRDARENPQFKSERAKMLFDYANKIEGNEIGALQQMLHVQNLNLDTLSDQQKRYEAFKLDPANKGYNEDEMRQLFAEEDLQKFGDPANTETPPTPTQVIRAKQATNEAQAKLTKMRNDFNQAPAARQSQTPEQAAAELSRLTESAVQALTGFKGIQLPVVAKGENGESLSSNFNFAIEKPEQLRLIQEGMVNPQSMWENVLVKEGIVDNAGNVDMQKFGKLAAEFLFRREMMTEAYSQGHQDGIAYKVKTARNPGLPPAGGGAPPAPPAPKNDAEGMGQALYEAIKGGQK